jgi:hypothetical protein
LAAGILKKKETNRRITVLTVAMAVIILGTWVFCSPDVYAQADESTLFSGLAIDPQGAIPFKLVGTIMEINQGDSPNLVVAEKTILITEYEYLNETQSTKLISDSDNTIEITDFETGQRVIVIGLKLPDESLVGEQIQIKPK